jgi:hypothetical protein
MRIALAGLFFAAVAVAAEPGFTALFDGKTLQGWKLVRGRGPGYLVENGTIVCPAEGGGNLFTELEYQDFVLRYEYRLSPGGNSGLGIRAPLEGDAAYLGMEIQILDDGHERYKGRLKPEQHTASIYDLIPARSGFQRPAGEWNEQEVTARGSHIQIKLNGVIVIDANLDIIQEPVKLKRHSGLKRESGHIGFLGHGTRVEFRDIRIKTL